MLTGCYVDYICAPFGNTIPDGMQARSFDCVIMLGGFAAGHLPLSRLKIANNNILFIITFQLAHNGSVMQKEWNFDQLYDTSVL